jgi:2'-5' RNA ligase
VPSKQGAAAVVVPVPAAEPVVGPWRERFDSSAARGMPAHITALSPFLDEDRLTNDVLAALREVCTERPALDVVFRRTARFPDVLYLDPEPADGLRQLTLDIAEQWPEAPPYRGAFDEVIPHLTVAHRVGADALHTVEADLLRGLPVTTRLLEARLYVFDGERWQVRERLPFERRRSGGQSSKGGDGVPRLAVEPADLLDG